MPACRDNSSALPAAARPSSDNRGPTASPSPQPSLRYITWQQFGFDGQLLMQRKNRHVHFPRPNRAAGRCFRRLIGDAAHRRRPHRLLPRSTLHLSYFSGVTTRVCESSPAGSRCIVSAAFCRSRCVQVATSTRSGTHTSPRSFPAVTPPCAGMLLAIFARCWARSECRQPCFAICITTQAAPRLPRKSWPRTAYPWHRSIPERPL